MVSPGLVVGFVALIVAVVLAGLSRLNDPRGGVSIEFESTGFGRESLAWDEEHQRFLVSYFEGGIGQVRVDGSKEGYKEELAVLDKDVAGNGTLGLRLDSPRHRILAVIGDLFGRKYSALAAYDIHTWERLYLAQLAGPEKPSLADDVALDAEGNAYVTDAVNNLIWKVSTDGKQVSVLTSSPVFTQPPNKLPFNVCGINGIVYHPDGYLLVVHTWSGSIFKVSLDGSETVTIVDVNGGPILTMDGIALLSPEKLIAAGFPGARLVESSDGWQTAKVTHRFVGPCHRVATGVTIKDNKAYMIHVFPSFGLHKRTHTIREAIFHPL